MIEVQCLGAARTVTGSKHLVKTARASVLLDCGLFQGHRKEANRRNMEFNLDGKHLDAILLSHAHIDHSGALPCIYKNGYRGPVYSTFATRDLCAPMLMDAASIMASDAKHLNKLNSNKNKNLPAIVALFNSEDVTGVLTQFTGISYNRKISVAPGIDLTFMDAGHVLGSAILVLDIEDSGKNIRLVFTGDLGRKHLPILRDPIVPPGTNYLIMESTYGNRLHDPMNLTTKALAEVIQLTVQRGGKIIIPSFALERAQELIYSIKKIYDAGLCPKIPVYIDSPLTIKLTEIFKLHPECFDQETFQLLQNDNSPFDFTQLRYVSSTEESKKISQSHEPSIVISASGMCEGGRILHHLASTVEDSKNTILIVGFQAENTLGRRLVEKQNEIKIYGTTYNLRAEVCVLSGFSGHADQMGLLNFAQLTKDTGELQKIILVHGELPAQETLHLELKALGFSAVEIPELNQTLKLTE